MYYELRKRGTRQGGKIMNGAAVIAEILKREGTGFLSCYPQIGRAHV